MSHTRSLFRPRFLSTALAGLSVLTWGCQPGSDGDDQADPTDPRRRVLQSIAQNVISPTTTAFASQAETTHQAVVAWADARAQGSDDAPARHKAAQTSWREAFIVAQRLELMQVGPAAPSVVTLGGEDLRDALYSWPTVDSCIVDRALVNEDYATPGYFEKEVRAYGLDALEYLLFTPDEEAHRCPPQVQLDGPWTALGPAEISRRRTTYAARVAQQLATDASHLAQRWSADGDDFARALATAGASPSPYSNVQGALDEVFRAMFYLEKQTKDAKLGRPMGLLDGCETVPCTGFLEAPYSGAAAAGIAANLQGLRLLLLGGPDTATDDGFDDILRDGSPGIVERMIDDIDAAIALATDFDEPLQEAMASKIERVEALYRAVKTITDTLKGPFAIAMTLRIPREASGDND